MPIVKFVEGYADAIAEGQNCWAWLELEVHWMIWGLLDVNPSVGACVTSQIFTFPAKLDALLALMKLRDAPESLIKRVNRFTETARAAQEARNRFAHDIWVTDTHEPSLMGRVRMVARRKLNFETESVPKGTLESDRDTIEESRQVITAIRKDLIAVLPTLPKIPPGAPHPLSAIR